MSLPYTALVTPDDVRRRSLDSLGPKILKDLSTRSGEIYETVEEICSDVTNEIEGYLNRQLIVRRHVLRFPCGSWTTRQGYEVTVAAGVQEFLRVARARAWPVNQILGVDDATDLVDDLLILESRDDVTEIDYNKPSLFRWLAYDPTLLTFLDDPFRVDTFSGYRRVDQTIEAGSGSGSGEDDDAITILTESAGLAGLAVQPPLLPGAIRRVALNLAITDVREQHKGLIGVDRTTTSNERLVVQSERKVADWREKQLHKLYRFKFIPA